ncbi:glycosyltransferase [Citrobacter farmeri]|uniref:glycosyltransferase n=1 Tax=Citrobacter farmeri TaxID=67824 RepID=UPI001904573C|nr:glycosyltransferase [Citrobacter farmeri]EKV7298479.1 glycosyltransferase [Citrobacter farmeri]MBJ8745882.1 glycosyltransferase [Citrobacter farmeri]MBJ8759133.1 glycosyltransferase [Citrobacter farmeri]MBJ9019084.1 glycosyltransferase [Citrobacter farmeri]
MSKKLVYIITKSEIGGAQKWIKEQKELLSNSFDIYLITSEPGWLSEQFAEDHVFFVKEISSFKSILASYKIAKFLRKIQASIVINNSANAGIHGRLAKLYYNHRSIYVSHGWSCIYNGGKFSKIFCLIERFLSVFTNKILCVSKKDFEKAITQIGISDKKLVTITNGIMPLRPRISGCLNGEIKLVFVGRMVHPKRPDLLLAVVSQFANVNIDMIGDGPLLPVLRKTYGSFKNIKFLGEVKNFDSFYKYDAFVLTSDSEGLPMSALEAASAGLPMLLSDVGGCSELIDDLNPNGILYNNEIESLSDSLTMLISNYSTYENFAEQQKERFSLLSKYDEYVYLINGK